MSHFSNWESDVMFACLCVCRFLTAIAASDSILFLVPSQLRSLFLLPLITCCLLSGVFHIPQCRIDPVVLALPDYWTRLASQSQDALIG